MCIIRLWRITKHEYLRKFRECRPVYGGVKVQESRTAWRGRRYEGNPHVRFDEGAGETE